MRAVVQRVIQAEVVVGDRSVARIDTGILALVAISRHDTEKDMVWMARKIVELRIFDDNQGKLNLSLQDVRGQLLVVSQFTLYGDCKKGRRPSYIEAAAPADAEKLYQQFVSIVRRLVPDVQTGQFQAAMEVTLTNSGPVTLILESPSVPSQKFVAYIGELSAALARRADDGISGIFRGGPTPPASSRADEICNELLRRDTSNHRGGRHS